MLDCERRSELKENRRPRGTIFIAESAKGIYISGWLDERLKTRYIVKPRASQGILSEHTT